MYNLNECVVFQSDSCIIGGKCLGTKEVNPANNAQLCLPGISDNGWSARIGKCAINIYIHRFLFFPIVKLQCKHHWL